MNKEEQKYPLASFCIVAYQEEKYIAEQIQAAFDQDYPNLEIVMTDDGSKDRTFEIMQEMAAAYEGPHKIILNKNTPNLGPRENYNKVMYELSHGEFVLFADGDDISEPNRTSRCVEFMMAHPEVSSMSVVSRIMDENGKRYERSLGATLSDGRASIFTLADYVTYPINCFSGDSRVLRRSLINAFPPLKYSPSEDIFLFIRSFYVGEVALLREPLTNYRQHSSSIMAQLRRKNYTKADLQKWEETTAKQIDVDLEYAIEHGYISREHGPMVRSGIRKVKQWLKPKRQTVWYRMTDKMYQFTSRMFRAVLRRLE